MANRKSTRRITIDVDHGLLSAVDATAGQVQESRNRFIVAAVEKRLKALRRERIDAAFARMAGDPSYQAEMIAIEGELAPATDAAWQLINGVETSPMAPAGRRTGARARASR